MIGGLEIQMTQIPAGFKERKSISNRAQFT